MDVILRRYARLGVWLTILAIAAGGAIAPPAHVNSAQRQLSSAASKPHGRMVVSTSLGESSAGNADNGSEVAKRGESRVLLALSSSARLLGVRLKAVGSPVLEKPQADRHVLLALERSSATSRTACLPLLRSTQLRI